MYIQKYMYIYTIYWYRTWGKNSRSEAVNYLLLDSKKEKG